MKNRYIWALAVGMGLLFLGLLTLQARYFAQVYEMRSEQFSESVERALASTAELVELHETSQRLSRHYCPSGSGPAAPLTRRSVDTGRAPSTLAPDSSALTPHALRDTLEGEFLSGRLVSYVYHLLYQPSDTPLTERIDYPLLDATLKQQLTLQGITLPYHYRLLTASGAELHRCPDYDPKAEENAHQVTLFPHDARPQVATLMVHFPTERSYFFAGARFLVPAILFTLALLVMYCVMVLSLLRARRLSGIKNDFIANMTHELKTPISSISLAAEMLSDPALTPSPRLLSHLSQVITTESRRLRMLVERVLQTSLLASKGAANFRMQPLRPDELATHVVEMLTLKVRSAGGELTTSLGAGEASVEADEMHLTNVVYNLIENALKYRDPQRPLRINVSSRLSGGWYLLCIEDNGIGIRRQDLGKIFQRFFRVHTGNLHNVKGFGLGLSYAQSVVRAHGGRILVDSLLGEGSTFTLRLPAVQG